MTINRNAMRTSAPYEGDNRIKLPVYDSGNETGNKVLNMDLPMRELFLANDSETNSLTIRIQGDADLDLSFTLLAGDIIDERFPEFLIVTVTATDSWRWFVRSGRIN